MNKVNVIKAAEMRENGATYEEIAKAFGVTRQAVAAAIGKIRKFPKMYDEIPYKGLYDFFKENSRIEINSFCWKALKINDKSCYERYRRLLHGEDVKLSISEIKKIIAYTGKSFEELFAERWFTDEQ
jgi:predicted transcriptional regulator